MAIDQRLINYVKESLDRGFSPEQIKSLLLGYGYSPAVIEEAFSEAQKSAHWKTILPIIAVAGVLVILVVGLYFFMPAKEESPAPTLLETETTADLGEFLTKRANFDVEYLKTINMVTLHVFEGIYHDTQGNIISARSFEWDPSASSIKSWFGTYQGRRYTCIVREPKKACLDLGEVEQQEQLNLSPQQQIHTIYGSDATIEKLPMRVIAGMQGSCFRIKRQSITIGEICLSQDGIMLYSFSRGLNTIEMTALSVRQDVKPEDFAPPAQPSKDRTAYDGLINEIAEEFGG